ncbi:E3 ubiquitin-protein ligase CCNB1IP1 [Lachnellula suecica]|uniref:E3 ubiquitin-protein ligase CCNB1IP1 n=1 Tax=Lachnellula suecica TaxID=602035 RepID=A0A8T9C9X0_9HELO|nr:E3 ubiquitin-protein ligase CCNB1IP1 [Lachnellula suecica]
MEHTLRCNVLKCRKELNDHAVVTTCSHVFCIDCSNRCQLSGQRDGLRPICPACDAHLTNPDDVVVTNLNPTEDYKTSVLSGLSPNIIMECAGRALSWWAYQTTQEIVYQEFLAKNLSEKYSSLNLQMDKIINDANSEISNLRNKVSGMQVDQESVRRKNQELVEALREKSRKNSQIQEMYDKLKRRAMLGQVQNAASDAVDHTIQASVTANRFVDRMEDQHQRAPQAPLFSNQQPNSLHNQSTTDSGRNMGPPNFRSGNGSSGEGGWAGFSSQESVPQNQPIQTPSTHRQRLAPGNQPAPRVGPSNMQFHGVAGTPLSQKRPSPRQPLANLSNNGGGSSGFAGYGMSAGMKVSNLPRTQSTGGGRPVVRSRAGQTSVPGFPVSRDSTFAPQAPNMFSSGNNSYY